MFQFAGKEKRGAEKTWEAVSLYARGKTGQSERLTVEIDITKEVAGHHNGHC